ncbi:MAG: metallophosphoesterase [Rhodospirillales bacterium]|jgi:hypothetical protein
MRKNILHLSDLHLSARSARDARLVIDSLLKKLVDLRFTPLRPDFLVFSGDVVNSGDDREDYENAYDLLIYPISDMCGIDESRIIVCPGNHDVSRSVVKNYPDVHSDFDKLCDSEQIDEALFETLLQSERHNVGIIKKFDAFMDFAYSCNSALKRKDGQLNFFDEIIKVIPCKDGITFVVINTAMNSTGGIVRVSGSKSDERRLLFPLSHLESALNKIQAKKIILVGHHPINWMHQSIEKELMRIIQQRTSSYLSGHLHIPTPIAIRGANGNSSLFQSGAVYTKRDRYNGFSIISLDNEDRHLMTSYFSYMPDRGEWDKALNVMSQGVFWSDATSNLYWKNHPENVNNVDIWHWIKSGAGQKIKTDLGVGLHSSSLADVFVEPTLVRGDAGNYERPPTPDKIIQIDEIVHSGRSIFIDGKREFGRTSLLKYIGISILDNCAEGKISLPVLVNYSDIQIGADTVQRAIRQFLPDGLPGEMTVNHLLNAGKITLLIDDVDPQDKRRLDILKKFVQSFSRVRVIASIEAKFSQFLGSSITPDMGIDFEKINIMPFSRNKMRKLVERWVIREGLDVEVTLSHVIQSLININLPMTGASGSLVLSSMSEVRELRTVNRATLVRNLIETLLRRHAPEGVFRQNFDYDNRSHYLGVIAEYMARNDRYNLSIEDFLSISSDYKKSIDIAFNPMEQLRLFCDARILEQSSGHVKFRYRVFAEYFIAYRMSQNVEFFDFVLSEGRYISYMMELDFYSGMVRHDRNLVRFLSEELDHIRRDVFLSVKDEFGWEPEINLFDSFRLPTGAVEKIAEEVRKDLRLPELNDEERDEILEADIPSSMGQIQEIRRVTAERNNVHLHANIAIMSRVLRNAEHLPAIEKKKYLSQILKAYAELAWFIMNAAPNLAKHKSVRINGVNYVISHWRKIEENELLRRILLAIPMTVSQDIYFHLGSEKMEPTIAELTEHAVAKEEPIIMKYFRAALLGDLGLPSAGDYFQKIVGELTRNGFIAMLTLSKLKHLSIVAERRTSDAIRPSLIKLLGENIQNATPRKDVRVGRELQNLRNERLVYRRREEERD